MTDQMSNWLTRGAIALGIFVLGAAVGWIGHSHRGGDVPRISFYQDWRLVCPADKEEKGRCQLATDISDPRSGTRLAQLTMGRQVDQGDKEILVVSVPLTVMIPPGVGLQIGTDTQTYQYATCVPSGCISTVPVDDKLLASLDGAKTMFIDVTAQNGRTVNLPVSVQGYGDASKALDDIEAKRHSWWKRLWS